MPDSAGGECAVKNKPSKGRWAEWTALILFALSYLVITRYHEPWFDEAQAWQIAKCASLREILFVLPHYEGHPPLWHLLLAVPAKLGVPFELGLKSVGFCISTASAALLLFRSRMPRLARLLLPFSYFFFYQYGIVVRPYGLALLVLLLLGMSFEERNAKPWRFTGLLALLCLCSAYGVVLAGGIALCMVWELWQEKGFARLLRELLLDARTQALLALLAAALLLIAEFFPRTDTYYPIIEERNPFLLCFLCCLLTLPGECFLTTEPWFAFDRNLLQAVDISIPLLCIYCCLGLLLWGLLISFSSKRNLKFLLVPYVLFSVFSALVYFIVHHIGLVFCFLLFWLELQCRSGDSLEIGRVLAGKICKTEHDRRLLRGLLRASVCVGLMIPLYWTVSVSYHEFTLEYGYGRSIASYLREHDMVDCTILTIWTASGTRYPQSEGHENYVNPYISARGTELSAYFSRNMSLNLNNGDDHMAYTLHKAASYTESQIAKEQWRQRGIPDLIVGMPDLALVYGDSLSYDDYSLVKIYPSLHFWKTNVGNITVPVFLRSDLVEQYGAEPITDIGKSGFPIITVTEEMREAYLNGVPIEEIVNTLLDEAFGKD